MLLHKILVNSFIHRLNSHDRVHGPDLWLIKMIAFDDEGMKLNVTWTLVAYLSKSAGCMRENGKMNGGHYVSCIARSLGYHVPVELSKCTVVKRCDVLDRKSLQGLLDHDNMKLVESLPQVVRNPVPPRQPPTSAPSGLESG